MNTRPFKILLASALLLVLAAPSYSKELYVLCYHAFLDKKDSYTLTLDRFKENLETLRKNGFTFVTFEDMAAGRIIGNKNILVTIDDGNRSVFEAYYSVMKPMGIRPVLGIYPAIIGRRPYVMDWDQLKKLTRDGCYIASHGYHHMFLSEKYYKKDPKSFEQEIYRSKKVLEEKLGKRIETMVFPFGVTSERAVGELKKAGYRYAFTLGWKMTGLPISDTFGITRYLMTKQRQKEIISLIVNKADKRQSGNGTIANAGTSPGSRGMKERAKKSTL